jgi:hypothetical protein
MLITKKYIIKNFPNLSNIPLETLIEQSLGLYSRQISDSFKSEIITKTNKILKNIEKQTEQLNQIMCKSVLKGKFGESIIEEWSQFYFPNTILKNMTKTSHSADFILETEPQILLEVKFHKNTVPQKEILKFEKDLFSSELKYGIFLSFSKISNIAGISIKKIKNKYVILLPNITKELFMSSILSIKIIDNVLNENKKNIDVEKLKNKIITLSSFINNQKKNVSSIKKKVIIVEKQFNNLIL